MKAAVQDYRNSEKTLNDLERNFQNEYISATSLEIKRMALRHFKGQQERLKYTGGKYLSITLFIAIMTLFTNIVIKLFISSPTLLWVIFIIITIVVILLTKLVVLQHAQEERGIYQATTMIELLENQIQKLESDSTEEKKETPVVIKPQPQAIQDNLKEG